MREKKTMDGNGWKKKKEKKLTPWGRETHKQMENERENTVFNEDITLAAATESKAQRQQKQRAEHNTGIKVIYIS